MLGAGYAAGRLSKKANAGFIGSVRKNSLTYKGSTIKLKKQNTFYSADFPSVVSYDVYVDGKYAGADSSKKEAIAKAKYIINRKK